MAEFEVTVSDEFEIKCPLCDGSGAYEVCIGTPGGGETCEVQDCPLCEGNLTIRIWVEDETMVDIEPMGY